MGWCSATEIFDSVCSALLDDDENVDKKATIKVLIGALWQGDWDCEFDSAFINHPLVKECFIELDHRFKEYYDESLGI